jgi:tripartite-type tricarboxylate transporter receptor subunit TctC
MNEPKKRISLLLIFVALSSSMASASIRAQTTSAASSFPNKPIRFVVPYPPGGPLDQVARLLSEKMRDGLGQPVIVENKAGAGGNIGADFVAKSPADGYTLLMGAVATHAINPYLYSKIPYDPNKDFTPITRVASVPNVLVMNPETAKRLNIETVKDVLDYAKKNPGRLNYASGGNGSAGHLAGELFKAQAKISMVHIAYTGAPAALVGLMGGQTDLMFDNLASAAPQIRAGKLKAFAVTSADKSSFFPELPTIAASGLANFDISTWFGVFLPANVPKPVVEKLHSEIVKALGTNEVKERLNRLAADATHMQPEAFGRYVIAEQGKYRAVIQASGAKID